MKYFNDSEFEHLAGCKPEALEMLDRVRGKYGKPWVLHCDQRPDDPAGSPHLEGYAFDFHIKTDEPLIAQAVHMMQVCADEPYWRLGVYPDWANPGFHLDCMRKPTRYWVRDDKKTDVPENKRYVYFGRAMGIVEWLKNYRS